MKRTYTPRKLPAEWENLVNKQQQSGLSAAEFCRKHQLSYTAFYKWRARLDASAMDGSRPQPISPSTPAFIDLGGLCSTPSSGWEITLHLGDGVSVQLRRS